MLTGYRWNIGRFFIMFLSVSDVIDVVALAGKKDVSAIHVAHVPSLCIISFHPIPPRFGEDVSDSLVDGAVKGLDPKHRFTFAINISDD